MSPRGLRGWTLVDAAWIAESRAIKSHEDVGERIEVLPRRVWDEVETSVARTYSCAATAIPPIRDETDAGTPEGANQPRQVGQHQRAGFAVPRTVESCRHSS